MEFRQLQAFVAVGETLNFSRAAEMLYVSQSTLSKRISTLEDDLGVRLLIRDTHSVLLTDQGAVFLRDARKLLKDIMDAEFNVRTYERGESGGHLSVGYEGSFNSIPFLAGLVASTISALKQQIPAAEIEVSHFELTDLISRIQRGEIDVGIGNFESNELSAVLGTAFLTYSIAQPSHVVLVKRENTANDRPLTLRALKKYEIMYVPGPNISRFDFRNFLEYIGFTPYISIESSWITTLTNISEGKGFAVCPKDQTVGLCMDSVAVIDIPLSIYKSDVLAMWKKENDNKLIQEFLSLCQKHQEN